MDRKKFIGFEVKSLSNIIKRSIDKQIADSCDGGASVTHGWVIRYIYDNMEKGDVFQRDLEARFNIRRSTATGILHQEAGTFTGGTGFLLYDHRKNKE